MILGGGAYTWEAWGGGGAVLVSGSLWYDPFVVGKRFGSSLYDLYYSIGFTYRIKKYFKLT